MAYDLDLSDRIRDHLQDQPGLTEKRMFGGLAFLIDGKMAVCANSHGALMVRVDPAQSESLVAESTAERMVMRGREMAGWLQLQFENLPSASELERWIGIGVQYARTLPPKSQ